MPRKTKTSAAAQKAALPQIPADFLEQLAWFKTGHFWVTQAHGILPQKLA